MDKKNPSAKAEGHYDKAYNFSVLLSWTTDAWFFKGLDKIFQWIWIPWFKWLIVVRKNWNWILFFGFLRIGIDQPQN